MAPPLSLFLLYSLTLILLTTNVALAAPSLPDFDNCGPTDAQDDGPVGLHCCPPKYKSIVDFDVKNYPGPLRVRRPAHLAVNDKAYVAKFERAIALMKNLSFEDPRNFLQQANVHCAYCDGAYNQLNHPKVNYLIHENWFFFPFHRIYLYFYERMLGKLINDPSFALPYWNWDHPDGMRMPSLFTQNKNSPLYDDLRDQSHLPPRVMDLNFNKINVDVPDKVRIEYNIWVMYAQVVRPTKASLFMGSPIHAGKVNQTESGPIQENPSAGHLENVPHNMIHIWSGNPKLKYRNNMGAFYSSGRDAMFYCHHANVDRMWTIWKNVLDKGTRQHFKDLDWLNAYFYLFDENRQLVRVRVRDTLDTEKLGYKYEQADLPWVSPNKPALHPKKERPDLSPEDMEIKFPVTLDKVLRLMVVRPKTKPNPDQEEVLVLTLDLLKKDEVIKFDVHLNDDEEYENYSESDPIGAAREYLGSFMTLPKPGKSTEKRSTTMRLAMSECLKDIGAQHDKIVQVVLVPRAGKGLVVIKDIKIEYVNE